MKATCRPILNLLAMSGISWKGIKKVHFMVKLRSIMPTPQLLKCLGIVKCNNMK